MAKGMTALKKARKNKSTDDFEVGTVVRWTAADTYTYAAIKTPIGWVTTARFENRHVKKTMTFEEFLEVIARAETTNVAVATEWTAVE